MKINPDEVIRDLDGEALKVIDHKTEIESLLTLRRIIIDSLLLNERDLDGEQKLNRFNLAKKIHEADSIIEVTVEEAVLIKTLVNKRYSTLVYARVNEVLENQETPAES